jgi:hypothetical protein
MSDLVKSHCSRAQLKEEQVTSVSPVTRQTMQATTMVYMRGPVTHGRCHCESYEVTEECFRRHLRNQLWIPPGYGVLLNFCSEDQVVAPSVTSVTCATAKCGIEAVMTGLKGVERWRRPDEEEAFISPPHIPTRKRAMPTRTP